MTDELANSYRGAFDGRLGFGQRPALILVDFVQAYFDPACPLYADVDAELAAAIELRDAARKAAVPVIYTNVVYFDEGRDGGVFYKKAPVLEVFLEGSPMGAWPQGLQPGEEEIVISKQYPSAFFGTQLTSILKERDIDSLLITGLTTSGCVRATCLDACCNGFIPIVVADACGDRHPEPHRANLFDMNAKYADVVAQSDALAHLASLVED